MSNSKIEWTDWTDNPIGLKGSMANYCVKVSPACKNCYAESMSRRLSAMGEDPMFYPYKVMDAPPEMELRRKVIDGWARMKKPRKIFVGSMTDIFADWVPDAWLIEIFDAMCAARRQTFQVLTKRALRMRLFINEYCKDKGLIAIPPHIWVGVTVESQENYENRIQHLLGARVSIRWLSIEPLLGPINMRLNEAVEFDVSGFINKSVGQMLHWVVVGGESASVEKCRPMHPEWARYIRDQCQTEGIPFFFKQSGSWTPLSKRPDKMAGKNQYCFIKHVDTHRKDIPEFHRPETSFIATVLSICMDSRDQWFQWSKNKWDKLDGIEYKNFPFVITINNSFRLQSGI